MIKIKPSYEILDRRSLSLEQKIEQAGRLAYKSEDKITSDSALPFCERIINSGHFPVLEFANLHLKVKADTKELEKFIINGIQNHKYLTIAFIDEKTLLISGTVRAFRDSLLENSLIEVNIAKYLYNMNPFLFHIYEMYGKHKIVDIKTVSTTEVLKIADSSSNIYPLEHLMCAVKFIVNRAVTHELVRHRPCSFIQESQRYCRYSNDKFSNQVTFIDPEVFFSQYEVSENRGIWIDTCSASEKAYLKMIENGASPQAARTVLPNSCKTEIIVYTTINEWDHIFRLRTSSAAEPSMQEIMKPLSEEFWNNGNSFWE